MLFNSRNLLEAARQAGCTIVHCPISFEPVRQCSGRNFVSVTLILLSALLRLFIFLFEYVRVIMKSLVSWSWNRYNMRYKYVGSLLCLIIFLLAEPYGILANVKQGQAFVSGSWGAEICSEMRPQTGEKIVKGKSGLCGFYSTNLDFLLR